MNADRLSTLAALAASVSGQAADLRKRADDLVREETDLCRKIAEERSTPLRKGLAIAIRPGSHPVLRIGRVKSFRLQSSVDPSASPVMMTCTYFEPEGHSAGERDVEVDLRHAKLIIIDSKEARERLGSTLFPTRKESGDDLIEAGL